jgi:hypothetical protein
MKFRDILTEMLQEQIDPITVGKNIITTLMNRFKPKPVQKGPLPFSETNLLGELKKQGVNFPDVAMAQAKLETGHFESAVFKENNNLFGMKHPSVRQTVSLGANRGHAKYKSWQDSVKDYKLWQDFYKVSTMNKAQFINKLNRIYCSPPECKAGDYANKVKSLMV